MPATTENNHNQGSFLGRISIRRNQVMSMDGTHDSECEEMELFQRHVAERFTELLSSTDEPEAFLSIAWLRKLLDEFLCCEAEFKAVLLMGRDPYQIAKPPLDKLLPEFLDRIIKSLDVCNAVSLGIDSLRNIQRLAEIVISSLDHTLIGDGQVRRAKKALSALLSAMLHEDKDGGLTKGTERSRSFGRRGNKDKDRSAAVPFRTLSWTMPKNWSAAKQIHMMSSNLAAPRGNESTGLALPVFIMNTVLVFVLWTLIAALPCQERNGLGSHFQLPRNLSWAQPVSGLQERISEEWKKKEKKGTVGLLEEMQKMEKIAQWLLDFTESFQFPAEAEKLEEVRTQVEELADICRKMDEGLEPLQMQIREVFHRVLRTRTEFLHVLDQAAKLNTPTTS
ncbi:hypothetical protein PIB30_062438 [Stylosanthes scabra]|uniref:Protein BYPASS-related protein n=1 Tax=Stylosanthes scabra TaxID=79078 RepID=A0ABU6ZJX7_9FABA|nr:hypothetical protein [Stylosanthes scabra]